MADIDHRAVIATLDRQQRTALTEPANAPGLLRAAGHLGAIVLLAALILAGVPLWPLLLLPQGILIVFLFTPLHESIHGTAFRSGWLNTAMGALCGLAVMVPPAWFRYFHFAHHRHTHDPERDPELATPKPADWPGYLLHLSGLPFWGAMIRVLLVNAAGRNSDPFVPAKGRARVAREARIFLAVYAGALLLSLALSTAALLWAWVVPALLGQPFLRAYLMAEHTGCPHEANMFRNTRTTFTTRLVRLLAWNMPFHAEHHAYPAVPFHRLPLFHAIVREHLAATERGYVRFHRKFAAGLSAERRHHTPAGAAGQRTQALPSTEEPH